MPYEPAHLKESSDVSIVPHSDAGGLEMELLEEVSDDGEEREPVVETKKAPEEVMREAEEALITKFPILREERDSLCISLKTLLERRPALRELFEFRQRSKHKFKVDFNLFLLVSPIYGRLSRT